MKVAIQGEPGSFHYQVAKNYFGADCQTVADESFTDVFATLNRHQADYAVVAIENSLYGSINEVYDLLETHSYPITGEVYLHVQQQLITLPGADLRQLSAVYSHPVALAQCEQYLNSVLPRAKQVSYHDTAAAVEYIKLQNNPRLAAIAGQAAADLHELQVAASEIEDHKSNYTRFVVLSRQPQIDRNANKSSISLETDHTPGSLAKVMSIFADNGVNLTKLQSRPIHGQVWKYHFYLDVEVAGDRLQHLLSLARPHCLKIDILGEYIGAKLDESIY